MAAIQSPAQFSNHPARPAEPLLASSLLAASSSSLYTAFDSPNFNGTTPSQEVLATGIPSLDDALSTVFQSSRLVALSSETSSVRDAVAKALLVDCLYRHSDSTVAVIDTTGNFDVVGLYALIVKRLEEEAGDVSGRGMEAIAAEVLDRVKIMRVFDFVGMREAVGELRDGLEGSTARAKVDAACSETEVAPKISATHDVEGITEKESQPQPRRTEIADSEDEDEDLEDSADEMLFDAPAPAQNQPRPQTPPADGTPLAHPEQQCDPPPGHLKLILIDNLAHVLHPLLKHDTPSANTLATTFLTTLRNLTRTHALHTILLNPCTTPRAPSPARKPDDAALTVAGPHVYAPQPPPPPSIFSSNAVVPALLGLMSRYADAHVLGSMLPWRKMDARVYYGDAGGMERGKRRGVQMVGVLEVIADRWGGRVGAWGAFKGKDSGIEGL